MTPHDIITRWRRRLDEWERLRVTVDGVAVCNDVLADLESWKAFEDEQLLTVHEAAATLECSCETIRRRVRDGSLVNWGGPRSIKVRRGELLPGAFRQHPTSPMRSAGTTPPGLPPSSGKPYDPEEDARDIAQRIAR
jgi:hypothetical protein